MSYHAILSVVWLYAYIRYKKRKEERKWEVREGRKFFLTKKEFGLEVNDV